ncbi:VWA domain-containing protein [Streptomyces sp. MS2A]|nr:VWA domain-containing protein [Streptomyces sp. MS2A]
MALSSLTWPWMLLAVAAAVVVAVVVGVLLGWRRGRDDASAAGAPVARAERVRGLGSFAQAVRRRRLALSGVVGLGVLAAVLAGVVAARPTEARTIQPETANRDIMLCLDVSGSMTEVDREVVTIFSELAEGFEGERIGLTIFNSSPVQVFPLTDDYEFVRTHLDDMARSFDYTDTVPEHWVGTMNGPGASLIGDGLASCALRFDHGDEERARSIILATDNELNGSPIVSLAEAAAFTASKDIRLYTINPVDGIDSGLSEELAEAAAATGGRAFSLRDTTTVAEIIDEVQEQEAKTLVGEATVVRADAPQPWIAALLVVALGFVVLLWRVRL